MNSFYLDINKSRPIALFSPYLDDKNFTNEKSLHYSAAAKIISKNMHFVLLKDDDRTFFIYKNDENEELWDDILEIATFYDVSYFHIDKEGLQNCEYDFIVDKLSLDYDEIKHINDDIKLINAFANKEYKEIHSVEFEKNIVY